MAVVRVDVFTPKTHVAFARLLTGLSNDAVASPVRGWGCATASLHLYRYLTWGSLPVRIVRIATLPKEAFCLCNLRSTLSLRSFVGLPIRMYLQRNSHVTGLLLLY